MRTVLTLTRSFLFLIVFATLSRCTGFIWTCGEANDAVNGIVDQNDSTRGQLRRVSLTCVCKIAKEGKTTRKLFWACDFVTGAERQSTWLEGEQETFHIASDKLKSRSLTYFDFDKSKPIQPANQGRTRAAIGRPEQLLRGVAINPRADMLFTHFHSDNGDAIWSIESVRRNLSIESSSNDVLVTVTGKHPKSLDKGRYLNARIDIAFSRPEGMSTKKFTTTFFMDGKKWLSETEVKSFASLGQGIYVPQKLEFRWSNSDSPNPLLLQEYEISNIKVNNDVPDSELTFDFPENVLVVDQDLEKSASSDRFDLFIAGSKGELIPISDVGELASQQLVNDRSPSSFYLYFAIGLALTGAVFVGWRRLRGMRDV